ncbi:MAG: protein kinase domain-containing protein, partial [Candidatus Acidiferrales bacterium]
MRGMRICPSCGQPFPDSAAQCPRCRGSTAELRTPFPVIAGYEAVRPLGEGGMGAVYLATELKLNRSVAVKVVSRKLGAGTEAEARFLREARSMAQVEHPHIVRVYSFGEVDGQPYLVMEYVEGQDLAMRLAREGSLPVEEALRITRQAAEALEAAWEHRVVHRDIKPSNILLDKRNQVRVGDFGLAKPIRADTGTLLTQESYVLGTPHYASPEQVRSLPLDFRSDIYSLGIVLYEMLTGERPFEGATPFDILNKQVMEPLPFLHEKRPDLPKAVAQLVAWMTMKDAGRRPASHRELIESLDSVQQGGTVRITPAEMYAPPTPPPVRVQPRRLPPLAYPALALVLTVAAVFGWFQWRQPPAQEAPKGLVVAVTPFYGPDEDSTKEGRVMAALVERAIADRLGKYDVKVLGVEETKEPVRDHEAARALGEKLGATVVVWGEAFALRGETEIQPYFTLVPPKQAPEKKQDVAAQRAVLRADPLAALQERAAETMRVGAAAPNQIEVRKTSAAGIGDVVLFLAGLHALRFEKDAKKALEFFQAAPRTAESLRYMAEAHLSAGEKDKALAVVREAVRLEPRSAPAQAMLGDLELAAGRLPEAAAAYRTALQ